MPGRSAAELPPCTLIGYVVCSLTQFVPRPHRSVLRACALCFCPGCARTLFLFPSQGHFLLFVEFYGRLLPTLLVLMVGLCLLAGFLPLRTQMNASISGYCLPLQAQV